MIVPIPNMCLQNSSIAVALRADETAHHTSTCYQELPFTTTYDYICILKPAQRLSISKNNA